MGSGDVWFFDRIARLYDLAMPPADRGTLAAGLARADGEVERVLDVGGGTGRAARAIDAPERVVVDASVGMLRRAPPEIERVLASATALPFSDGSADAVVIVDALHHLPDPPKVFAEAARALRPGGVLVVREFDRATLRGRLIVAVERIVGMHSTLFTADELEERLGAAGLEAAVLDRGFSCTVVGRKPGEP